MVQKFKVVRREILARLDFDAFVGSYLIGERH
jgi:hypothetical protein